MAAPRSDERGARPRRAPGATPRGRGRRPAPWPPRPGPPRTGASPAGRRSAPGRGHARAARSSTVRSEMNDRSADDHVDRLADHRRVERAHVGALDAAHPGVGPQPLVELAVADVDGHDLGGAVLEEAVGEAAGRGAGVEHPAPVERSTAKRSSAASSLLAAPAHEAGRRAAHDDGLAGRRPGGRPWSPARPPTVTRPASMSAWARSRLAASPRRTSSASRRRRVLTGSTSRRRSTSATRVARSAATRSAGRVGGQVGLGGDPGQHQAEAVAEGDGEAAVGVGPVAHHHAVVAEALPHAGRPSARGACPPPRASTPDGGGDRRPRMAPPPGIEAVGRRVGGVVVGGQEPGAAADRAPTRRPSARSRSRGGSPTTTTSAVARPGTASTTSPRGRRAPRRRPGPPHTRTRSPGSHQAGGRHRRGDDVAAGGDAVARPAWPPRRRAGRRSCWSRTRPRSPAARSRATASAAPGMGWSPEPDHAVEVERPRPWPACLARHRDRAPLAIRGRGPCRTIC